jgi:deoxycytidylate deaminase
MGRRITRARILNKRGRVISEGINSFIKTHPYQARLAKIAGLPDKLFLHAEIDAILKCKRLDEAHTIEVSRFGCDGNPLNAKPCPICDLAIKEFGIKEVIFTK